jgi:hypothetical protein
LLNDRGAEVGLARLLVWPDETKSLLPELVKAIRALGRSRR